MFAPPSVFSCLLKVRSRTQDRRCGHHPWSSCLETGTMPKRGPAHPGLNSIDPFGALVVICCTIIFAAWLFHDTPVQHVVAAVVAFYAVFALAVAIVCRNGKVSQS